MVELDAAYQRELLVQRRRGGDVSGVRVRRWLCERDDETDHRVEIDARVRGAWRRGEGGANGGEERAAQWLDGGGGAEEDGEHLLEGRCLVIGVGRVHVVEVGEEQPSEQRS